MHLQAQQRLQEEGCVVDISGVASLLITEGESKAELDDSSLPPLVLEG